MGAVSTTDCVLKHFEIK